MKIGKNLHCKQNFSGNMLARILRDNLRGKMHISGRRIKEDSISDACLKIVAMVSALCASFICFELYMAGMVS